MKIYCEPGALAQALAQVAPAVPSRSRVPILSYVLLRAKGDRVTVSATDLGLGVTCWLPARVEREGAVAVPFARLIGSLSPSPKGGAKRKAAQEEHSPAGAVEVDAPAGVLRVSVSSGRRQATIQGAAAEDFPVLPSLEHADAGEGWTRLWLDLPQLCAMVEQVACAADHRDEWARSRAPGNPPLHARVLLVAQGGEITLAARNEGFLALCEGPLAPPAEGSCTLVLPAGNLAKIMSLLQGTGEPSVQVALELTAERGRALFRTPGLDVVTSLPEQTFAEFGQLVPGTASSRVLVAREPLAAALAFVDFVASRNGGVVELWARPETGALLVCAREREMGEQSTEIGVSSAAEAAGFRCATASYLLGQSVAAARASLLSLEWYAREGTLVVRSHVTERDCRSTYAILRTKALPAQEERGEGYAL